MWSSGHDQANTECLKQLDKNFTLLDNLCYRYRRNEESMSNDLMSVEDDFQLVESPNFDSSVNLCKDNEDNNSGDVYLLLQPHNN